MKRRSSQIFTESFKQEAIWLVTKQNYTVPQIHAVCEDFGHNSVGFS